MDGLGRIKVKRALPGIVAGAVLCAVMLFVFYSMTPDQRIKRTLRAVFNEHHFELVGERTEGLTTTKEKAFVDVYESPVLDTLEIERLDDAFRSVIGYEHTDTEYSLSALENDFRTYVYTRASLEIAEIQIVPVYTDVEGKEHTRLIVRHHKGFNRNLWQLIFG